MSSSCLTRGSTSKPLANGDKRICGREHAKVNQTLHVAFFLWLVVSVALILTAIFQPRASVAVIDRTNDRRCRAFTAARFPVRPS